MARPPRLLIAAALLVATACSGSADVSTATTASTHEPVTTQDSTATADTTTSLEATPSSEAAVVESGPSNQPLDGVITIDVVAMHPHDADAFTQGLEVIAEGRLVESTGLYGESDRRITEIATGSIETIEAIDDNLFGEGLTVVGDEVVQLTWRAGVYLRADLVTLVETGRGTYEGEGWGLCFDGDLLVMSDGSATLTFRDPVDFMPLGTVEVSLGGEPVENLNELECVNGQVLANVWLTDLIVVIDPATGDVDATIDASALRPEGIDDDSTNAVLNGIAHDPTSGHFYLTGKNWPVLYEVALS